MKRRLPWVVVGLEGIQRSAGADHGAQRKLTAFAPAYISALATHQPQVLAAVSFDARLPVPDLVSVLPSDVPMIETGIVPNQPGADYRIVFHALSVGCGISLDLFWPRWARDAHVAFVAGVHDASFAPTPNPGDRSHDRFAGWSQVRAIEQADSVIAPSHSAAVDLIGSTMIDPTRVFVAHEGTPAGAGPHPGGQTRALEEVSKRLGVRPGFLVTSTPADRDEVSQVIAGFAALPADLRSRHQLVLPLKDTTPGIAAVLDLAGSLGVQEQTLLVGDPDNALVRLLYQSCYLMLQPWLTEDSSTRTLEAMACGAVTVVGDVGVLREIVPEPEARFDPGNAASMSHALEQALTGDRFRSDRLADSQRSIDRMSWEGSAREAAAAYAFATSRRP